MEHYYSDPVQKISLTNLLWIWFVVGVLTTAALARFGEGAFAAAFGVLSFVAFAAASYRSIFRL